MQNIPISTGQSFKSSSIEYFSLKLGDDLTTKLAKSKSAGVEIKDGKPIALVIDDGRYSLLESQEAQQVDVAKVGDGNLVIGGCVRARLSIATDQVNASAIREMSQQAEKQRTAGKILKLEEPASSPVKKMARLETKMPSIERQALKVDAIVPLKDQIIHVLAIEDMAAEAVALKLGCPITDISAILPQISIPNGILWKLKPGQFSRIDVNNWPKYSAKERQLVSRRLGIALQSHQTESLRPADATRLADQKIKRMMRSTRGRK